MSEHRGQLEEVIFKEGAAQVRKVLCVELAKGGPPLSARHQ
jgi:hypothetical protein